MVDLGDLHVVWSCHNTMDHEEVHERQGASQLYHDAQTTGLTPQDSGSVGSPLSAASE